VMREVREIMRGRTRDEWLAHFAGADVCLTAVHSRDEGLADPHVAARGVVAFSDDAVYVTPPRAKVRPAPALGADTDAVLEDAGIDASARARLRANHVI